MPRGMGRGYGRRGYYDRGVYSYGGAYGLLNLLILIGIIYFLFKLFVVALPYALGLVILVALKAFLTPGQRPLLGIF
ncbi:hypothetical protein [Thermococcus sp.]